MKIGIIGVGSAGRTAIKAIEENGMAKLTAILSRNPDKTRQLKEEFGEHITYFNNEDDFFKSNLFDSVIITTDHYSHPKYTELSLKAGYNTLVEKPLGVTLDSLDKVKILARDTDKNFGIIYNQRLNPAYLKIKELIDKGEIGEIKRNLWIMTTNFRTQAYYDSSEWRGTWEGEGGGVLLNQCSHTLDIWQWICGMPKEIQSFCQFGKERDVEIETEATIYAKYPNGSTGVFIASVLEYPGTNRLEIIGNKGKIVLENDIITISKLDEILEDFNKTLKVTGDIEYINSFKPTFKSYNIVIEKFSGSLHREITKEWIKSVVNKNKFIAPGLDGLNAVSLIENSYKSSKLNKKIEINFQK